jgi:hypothetical protein
VCVPVRSDNLWKLCDLPVALLQRVCRSESGKHTHKVALCPGPLSAAICHSKKSPTLRYYVLPIERSDNLYNPRGLCVWTITTVSLFISSLNSLPRPSFLVSWGSCLFEPYSRCDSLSLGVPVPFQFRYPLLLFLSLISSWGALNSLPTPHV